MNDDWWASFHIFYRLNWRLRSVIGKVHRGDVTDTAIIVLRPGGNRDECTASTLVPPCLSSPAETFEAVVSRFSYLLRCRCGTSVAIDRQCCPLHETQPRAKPGEAGDLPCLAEGGRSVDTFVTSRSYADSRDESKTQHSQPRGSVRGDQQLTECQRFSGAASVLAVGDCLNVRKRRRSVYSLVLSRHQLPALNRSR